MATVAILLSAALAGMGAVGIVSPARLLEIARRFQTPSGIYAATGVRLVLGLALFLAAPGSRAPAVLEVLGIVIMVAGLITPMFGLERFRRILDWWSAQGPGFLRAWAACVMAFGLYLIYALAA
jgi:hypothetical protein